MRSIEPVRHVVLLEELDAGGVLVEAADGGFAVAREPRGIRLGAVVGVGELVARLLEVAPESSAVEGEGEVAGAFAEAWAVAVGKQVEERGGVRLYRLGELKVPVSSGRARLAGSDEVELCAEWLDAMIAEEDQLRGWTMPRPLVRPTIDGVSAAAARRFAVRDQVRRLIDGARLWVLEDGGVVVAMAGHRPVRGGVVRLGPIYTPPEYRRRGYGSALTGQLVDNLRAAEVCLRTDLGNPHSHRVYQQLGFETVVDLRRFQLSSVDSPGARPR
ncbi:GNAT family N-acetyltransferase [Kribbella jiaozuonensis]|uniref:GNAT family N-acetyltransferase n=1 Tax=Kribbella jiaozuonensis TaxID=2575441 RepID=A0A4U3LRT8_9ACTN|nr:GNAT family N-acetyltransferase [Kribbella jiaozuonensis]TKK78452.1 GNAT family N-acetyltransferase [Kribbella jiaozuonensis]